MINIELLDAVVEKTREILSNYKLRNAENEYRSINVYTQNLPQKTQKNDTAHFPYVLALFNEETIEEKDEIEIYFICGIIDSNPDKQGYRDVLGIINKLYRVMLEKPIVGEFRMKDKCKIMLQQENTFPYFIGGMETTWTKERVVNMQPTELE